MMYGDNLCTYKEIYEPEHGYEFTGPCIRCKEQQTVFVVGEELYAYRQGASIQKALLSNSADEREFLMSGICSKCFDKMFSETDDE